MMIDEGQVKKKTKLMQRQWVCCQVGAREHYAIPRSLHGEGLCAGLITDYWSRGKWEAVLPAAIREKLVTRVHPELADESVVGLNVGFLKLEMAARIRKRGEWPMIMHRNGWFQKAAARKLKKIVLKLGSDLPPIVFAYSYAAYGVFEAAKKHGCSTVLGQIDPGPAEVRLVAEIHQHHGIAPLDTPPDSYWDNWWKEIDLADRIVVNSAWSQIALVNEGVPESKIRIVPLAYEVPSEASISGSEIPHRFSHERPLEVLFLGQVIARKGIIELIQSFGLSSDSPVHWTIVGGGDAELMERISGRPNVTVTGQVDRHSAIQYYQNADTFILPTHSDGYAITQLEAMAYGLPVIASKMCGDVVEDMKTGLLLDDVSPASIVAAIKRLLDQPRLLANFRDNIAGRKFNSLSDLGQQLVGIFDD